MLKKDLVFKSVPSVENLALKEVFELSACFVEHWKTLIVCVYRNPLLENLKLFLERLDLLLSVVSELRVPTVFVADFNKNFNSHDLH